jgi:hypothetical protein
MGNPKQRKIQWEKDRQSVANAYFDGNRDSADSALNALPYSAIPGWSDLALVLQALVDLGWRKPHGSV